MTAFAPPCRKDAHVVRPLHLSIERAATKMTRAFIDIRIYQRLG